jgi:hypothetical protein
MECSSGTLINANIAVVGIIKFLLILYSRHTLETCRGLYHSYDDFQVFQNSDPCILPIVRSVDHLQNKLSAVLPGLEKLRYAQTNC